MNEPPIPNVGLEQLATPVVQVAPTGLIAAVNPAFAAWLGYSARRFVDLPLDSLAPGDPLLSSLLARTAADGRTLRAHRVRLAPSPDHERFADLWVSALDDGRGHLLEFHPVEEFPGADPATAMPAALHEAFKGLAHEIRNPLAGLRGAAQLLGKRVSEPDGLRYLEIIVAESERLSSLVDRLLNPPPPRAPAPVNVHEVLERVRLLSEAEAGWSALVMRDYDPSLPTVMGDADRLTQAVWNLVRNAIEAGSSEVRLRTRAETQVPIGETVHRRALRIEVVDNGRGVADELASRIFLPLVSGRAEGSGLGLTLAQQVAREHRGSLSYRSRPGHTVFTLLLPMEDEGVRAEG
jgi:two-component system nitrogen regulation sensor histidine kinase GlnL